MFKVISLWLLCYFSISMSQAILKRSDVLPLNLHFAVLNSDNYVTNKTISELDSDEYSTLGYHFVRREGYILKTQLEGTVPLYVFYHPQLNDHILANVSFAENGYKKLYLVGYVFVKQSNSTTPLYQYYSQKFNDHFACATSVGVKDATSADYTCLGIIGHVLIAEPISEFVTVTQDMDGIWWVAQRGNHFMTIGVNHVNNGGMDDGVGGRESVECQKQFSNCGDTLSFAHALGYSPYYNSTMRRYGSEETWANTTRQRLLQWNFNTISGWSATVMERQPGLLYCHLLDIGTTWLNHSNMGDVFSQDMYDQMYSIAAKQVAPRSNDTNLIGWQFDNEFNFNQDFLAQYLSMSTSSAGRRAVKFLQDLYDTIEDLNKAWNVNATSFNDVVNHIHDSSLNKTEYSTSMNKFTFIFATQYFNLSSAAIRHYDSNHLLLGMRLSSQNPQVIRAMIPYVDWVDQHMYSDVPQLQMLEDLHQATGKPVIVGEFSFTAVDSNLPNTRGARSHNAATTQVDRASLFTRFVTELSKAQFVVGYHWWQWADEPATGRWPDGENSNYGLVHIDDDEYHVLTEEMTKTNKAVQDLHKLFH